MGNAYHYQHTFDDNLAREFRNVLTVKSQLPVTEGLQLWLDSSDISTIDVVGVSINQWRDKSGNANHANQNTPTNQPTLVENQLNGLSVIRGDGADNYMTYPNLGLDGTADVTLFAVFKVEPTTSGFDNPLCFGSNSEARIETRGSGVPDSGDIKLYSAGFANGPTIGTGFNEFQTLTLATNSANFSSSVNGASSFNGSTSGNWTTGVGDYALFGGNAGGRHLKGDIAEVIIFSRSLTAIEREQVEVYLADKWGLYHSQAEWIKTYDPRVISAIHTGRLSKSQLESADSPLAAWFDTRDANTITIENNKVTAWQSKAFTNHKFEQGSDILRPSLVDNAINGLPAIEITGDEWMYVIGLYGAGFPQEGGTLFIAGEIAYDETTTPRLLFDYFASNRNHIFIRPYNGIGLQVAFQANDGTYKWVHGNLLNSRRFILRLTWDTVNNVGSLWINGSAESVNQAITDATWVPDDQRFMLRTLLAEGMLIGEVLLYDRVLPIAEQERVEQELLTVWGET